MLRGFTEILPLLTLNFQELYILYIGFSIILRTVTWSFENIRNLLQLFSNSCSSFSGTLSVVLKYRGPSKIQEVPGISFKIRDLHCYSFKIAWPMPQFFHKCTILLKCMNCTAVHLNFVSCTAVHQTFSKQYRVSGKIVGSETNNTLNQKKFQKLVRFTFSLKSKM